MNSGPGALRTRTVELDQLGVIDVRAESAFDRFQIRSMTIARKLDAIGQPRRNVIDKGPRAIAVATADEIANDELRIGVQANPRPNVSSAFRSGLRPCDVLLLGVNESPSLIDLNALGCEVADVLVMIGHADLANGAQELGDGILRNASGSADGADRHALAKQVNDTGAIGSRKLFHASMI